MTKPTKQAPEVVKHNGYEIITPDTSKLRSTLRKTVVGEADPVARAEQALNNLSGHFSDWMTEECDRLDAARHKVRAGGLTEENRLELASAAQDVMGNSQMFGFPEMRQAAVSLCRLLEFTPDFDKIPIAIIDQHVDAVRAIKREYSRSDIAAVAAILTSKLRSVTDEFLLRENQHRPEILEVIKDSSLVPTGSGAPS